MKKLLAILLLFLGAYMNANTPNQSIKFDEIKDVKIPVIYEESSLLPTGFIQLVFIGGGSINDGQKDGLSRLGANLLNEGTKKLGATKFSELLEEKAINISAGTGLETLSIDISYLKDQEKNALHFLDELLKSPNLTQDTLTKIQTQTVANLLNKQNDFDYIASTTLSSLLFKGTPLAEPALGTIKSVQNISLADIQAYLEDNLVLKKLVIVMGGDINTQKTLSLLKPILSQLKVGEKSKIHHYDANSKPEEETVYKDTQQAYIYFGSPFVVNNLEDEGYKAKVMSFILGSSGFGSRLMEEIRVKRGLAYSAYMRIVTNNVASYTTGYLQTQLQNQAESIKLVKEVIDEFVQKGVTQAELDGAKRFLLGSEPLRNETLSQRLYTKFYNFYLGLPLDFDKTQLEQIKKLSLKALNEYIKSHTEIKNLTFSIVTKKESK